MVYLANGCGEGFGRNFGRIEGREGGVGAARSALKEKHFWLIFNRSEGLSRFDVAVRGLSRFCAQDLL